MDNRKAVLSLLFLTVVASGCSHVSNSSTGSEGGASITVKRLDVRPQVIHSGGEVNIWAEAENTGTLTGQVMVGEKGKKVLRDYCSDIFQKKSFSVTTTAVDEKRKSYTLKPGQTINMRWQLKQQGRVPIYGIPCDIRLELPFNYRVSAYRQIQVKKSRKVKGSSKLSSESTSGPLLIAVETLPSITGKKYTFVPEDKEVTVQIQFVNKKPTGEFRKGLIDVHENSLSIEATGPLELDEKMSRSVSVRDASVGDSGTPGSGKRGFAEGQATANQPGSSELSWKVEGSYNKPRCEVPSDIRIYKGHSTVIRCEVPIPSKEKLKAPSQISEISVSANYTYIKNLGQKTVKVEQAAN